MVIFNSLNGLNPGFSISLIVRSSRLGKNKRNIKLIARELLVLNLMFLRMRECFWKVGSRNATKIVLTFAAICQEHTLDELHMNAGSHALNARASK